MFCDGGVQHSQNSGQKGRWTTERRELIPKRVSDKISKGLVAILGGWHSSVNFSSKTLLPQTQKTQMHEELSSEKEVGVWKLSQWLFSHSCYFITHFKGHWTWVEESQKLCLWTLGNKRPTVRKWGGFLCVIFWGWSWREGKLFKTLF